MAIEDILNALEEQAQADIDAVMAEAGEHAKLILDEAEGEARRIHDHFVHQVERVAEGKASKQVNAARLTAKMAVSSARGEGLQSVFVAAKSRLSEIRSQSGYPALFRDLAEEALSGIAGSVVVRVAPEDEALARETMRSLGAVAEVDADLQTDGGLVVEAEGGRIVRRNTLEDRLDRSRQLVEADVARVLFA